MKPKKTHGRAAPRRERGLGAGSELKGTLVMTRLIGCRNGPGAQSLGVGRLGQAIARSVARSRVARSCPSGGDLLRRTAKLNVQPMCSAQVKPCSARGARLGEWRWPAVGARPLVARSTSHSDDPGWGCFAARAQADSARTTRRSCTLPGREACQMRRRECRRDEMSSRVRHGGGCARCGGGTLATVTGVQSRAGAGNDAIAWTVSNPLRVERETGSPVR